MKAKLSFFYDHHLKFPNRNTGVIFKVDQTSLLVVVIFMETLVLLCLASHFDIIEI